MYLSFSRYLVLAMISLCVATLSLYADEMPPPSENSGSILETGSTVDTRWLVTQSMQASIDPQPSILLSSTATIHSIAGYGNWNDPASWIEWRVPDENDVVQIHGIMNLDTSPTIAGIIVNSWATISGFYRTLTISGLLENYGNWYISYTVLSWDLVITNSTTIEGELTLNNHSIVLPYNGSLTVRGTISWTWRFYGDNTTLNTYGDINTLNISGSWLDLNIYGSSTRIYETNIQAEKVTLHSGSLVAFYVSNWSAMNTNFEIYANTFLIQSWATLISGYGRANIFADVINEGTIQWTESFLFNLYWDIENKGVWNIPTYISWLPTPWATWYNIVFDPGNPIGFLTNTTTYDIMNRVWWSYYYTITSDNWVSYPKRCINIAGCITWTNSTFSLLSSTPIDSATGVEIDSNITLNFSKPLDQSTVPGNIILRKTGGDIIDTVALSYSLNSIVFHAILLLENNTAYTVELNTGLKDIDGNTLGSATSISFATVNILPKPTGLSQQIQSLGLDIQPIRPWEKIGKYQSGSGVILTGSVNTRESSRLVVAVYKLWDTTPQDYPSEYTTDPVKKITLPYLWAWSYRWKARVETLSWDVGDWVDYGTDNPDEVDYILYEWFEPYPYGYSFENNIPANWFLTGWVGEVFWTGERYKIDGNKWEIFNLVFPLSTFWNDERKQIDWFESIWLNNENPRIFFWWNCFWMAFSALNIYYKPQTLNSEFPDFYNLLGASGTIWNIINPPIVLSWSRWNNYNTEFKTILAYQLYQKMNGYVKLKDQSKRNQTPNDILNYLRNNPNKPYILTISWRTCYFNGLCPTQYHAVVPYKVEWNRIYLWDNNVPFSKNNNDSAYNQYIEINPDNTWSSPYYNWDNFGWDYFEGLTLVNINDMYSLEQQSPIWFNWNDYVISLSWDSDVYFQDSQWRISGFSWSTILEQIPWVIVVKNLGISKDWVLDNTWKQIYLPQKISWLTIKVSGKTTEPYDLMIAWWDYYTKVSWVTTSTWQLDTFNITWTGISIDFDNQKTGNYSLLTDNFQPTLTGTIFLSGIVATPVPQNISYDWNKVIQKTTDALLYQIDTNSDGIYDLSSNYSPVPTSPNSTWSISWYVKWNTNATMAGWKIILTRQQDDNTSCKEEEKGWEKRDNRDIKNKWKNKECRDDDKDEKYENNRNNQYPDDRKNKDYNRQIFAITDKKWYYRFTNLSPWNYSVLIEPQKNWSIIKPQNNIYNITLNSWQNIIDLNFESKFLKGKNK